MRRRPTRVRFRAPSQCVTPAPTLQASASPQSAVDFIIETVEARPGEVTVLALAACTNIALALRKRPKLHTQWRELVILGGAFQTSGNVNPAAEANIFGDPEAAEYVLSRCTNVRMVGLDTTHSCSLSAAELESMAGARPPDRCAAYTALHR